MRSDKISYAGIAGAVGGIVAMLGVYAGWWSAGDTSFDGTQDVSGGLALAMAVATFAFGAAYVLMADPKIRRALGALVSICAVVLTLACVWGLTRGDQVAAHTDVKIGLWISVLGGIIGIAAGILALRDSQATDAASPSPPITSGPDPISYDPPTAGDTSMGAPSDTGPSSPSDTSS